MMVAVVTETFHSMSLTFDFRRYFNHKVVQLIAWLSRPALRPKLAFLTLLY